MNSFKQSIEILNNVLTYELGATSQSMVHSGIYYKSGYKNIHDVIRKRGINGMKHAEMLIERILFLDGIPDEKTANRINISHTLGEQLANDYQMEESVIRICTNSIFISLECNDYETAELFRLILLENERHLAWLESELGKLKQLQLDNQGVS